MTLRIMRSDGGFGKSENVRASQLLLSGPAGGLIGCKSIIPIFEELISTPVNSNYHIIKTLSASIWAEHQQTSPEFKANNFQ